MLGRCGAAERFQRALVTGLRCRLLHGWAAFPHPGDCDDFTRESLALTPNTALSGAGVARQLDALIELTPAEQPRLRQRHGPDQDGDPEADPDERRDLALPCPEQARRTPSRRASSADSATSTRTRRSSRS